MAETSDDLILTAKARKGDLILVESRTVNHYSVAAHTEAFIAGRELPSVTTTFAFGVVDSATRDGVVKTWRPVGYGDQLICSGTQRIGVQRRLVLSAKRVDVTGVLTAAKAHHWPGHPTQPRPFDTHAEAVAVVRPFLTKQGAKAARS